MRRRVIWPIVLILLITMTGLYLVFLQPRSYDVAKLKQRAGTKYWKLSTGSVIGYTLVPGKGPKKPFPLIYLHGGPGAGISDREIAVFSPLADEGFDVYLYDQLGCGHSSRLDDITGYTTARHVQDLEQIIRQIGSQKVILLAQSWGCILASLFLAEYPELVEKIAVTASGPLQPEIHALKNIAPPDSLQLREPYASPVLKTYSKNLRVKAILYAAKKWGKKIAADEEADQLGAFLANALNKSMVCDTASAVRSEGTEGFYTAIMTVMSFSKIKDPRPVIRNLNVPVLIMKGQCDNQKWGYTTEFFELFPNHRFVLVPGAGHNIFIEKPGPFVRIIKDFIFSVP